jgi:hypothetical protein
MGLESDISAETALIGTTKTTTPGHNFRGGMIYTYIYVNVYYIYIFYTYLYAHIYICFFWDDQNDHAGS